LFEGVRARCVRVCSVRFVATLATGGF